ncbi:MAG TPA: cation:proton antiporter [Gemmatimonadales bacterium]|nr:cation:proton antiporter [Gemmatimonadales bacterium]
MAGLPLLAGAAGELPVARFFTVLAVMLLVGKLAGEAFERWRQPAVMGELLAGILLGTGVLKLIPTDAADPLTPVFQLLAEVGVVVLLFEIGLATDLKAMIRTGSGAAAVAVVGVAVPFVLGFLYWRSRWHDGDHSASDAVTTAIFVGAALTATSVGITARVLKDLRVLHSLEARLILGAAVIDDVIGLVILGVVSGLATGVAFGLAGVLRVLGVAVAFLFVALWIGVRFAPPLFALVDRMQVRGVLVVTAFAFVLLLCVLAERAGTALIIGAFAAGLILSETNQSERIEERIKPVADIFTPIFFLSIGAAADLRLWNPFVAENGPTLAIGGALLVIAIIGKLASGWAVPWLRINRRAVGLGMAPRGEVGLIFAQIGLTAGILSPPLFSGIVFVVIATTLLTPPLLKRALESGVTPDQTVA